MEGALTGIRVLDLSRLLPGPFCSMLLADMGADVIKVEDPKGGDYIRAWPPHVGKNSGFHVVLNRNKRSMALNLKDPEDVAIFKLLVKTSDVVLEGFRPGVMTKLGVGYEALQEINPRLVYCAITGYGLDGARAMKAGHDLNYLALSGVISYNGRKGAPTMAGVQIADLGGGGLLAAFSIVTGAPGPGETREGAVHRHFHDRWRSRLELPALGQVPGGWKVPAPGDDMLNHGFACYNIYETKDGRHMTLGALEPQFWKLFCETVGRAGLASGQLFRARTAPGSPHQGNYRSFFHQDPG